MSDKFNQKILEAHERSFDRAFEAAVRTGTELVFFQDGKVVKVKPPFRYVMVPIKSSVKKSRVPKKK